MASQSKVCKTGTADFSMHGGLFWQPHPLSFFGLAVPRQVTVYYVCYQGSPESCVLSGTTRLENPVKSRLVFFKMSKWWPQFKPMLVKVGINCKVRGSPLTCWCIYFGKNKLNQANNGIKLLNFLSFSTMCDTEYLAPIILLVTFANWELDTRAGAIIILLLFYSFS